MRNYLLVILFLGSYGTAAAQIEYPSEGCRIRYQYDAAGNRIQRDWYCWGSGMMSEAADQDSVNDETKRRLVEVHMNAAPNPVSDRVTVTFTEEVPNGMLEVLDATGRSVRRQRAAGKTTELDLSDLGSGSYWLSFSIGEERIITAIFVDGTNNKRP